MDFRKEGPAEEWFWEGDRVGKGGREKRSPSWLDLLKFYLVRAT